MTKGCVPTERQFNATGPLIAIGSNNLKPSHSGNTYLVQFLLFSM